MQSVHEGYGNDEYGGQHDNNQNYWKQKVHFVPWILFTTMLFAGDLFNFV